MTIADRLKHGAAALTIFIAVGGIVSYRMIHLFDRNVGQIISINEPLTESVFDMQMNIARMARAVSSYVREHEADQILHLDDLEADFDRTAADFRRLAEPKGERSQTLPGGMADELERTYRPVNRLAAQIVRVVDR